MGPKLKGFLIVLAILLALSMFLEEKNVAKAISKDKHFQYNTSITSRYDNHDRADVYTSNEGVIETARRIIEDERPISHSDLDNSESISITYDDYYVLVYKGEDNVTYVQVSSRSYVHRNGFYGLYRPHRNTIIFFDNTYRRKWYDADRNRYGGGGYYNTKTNTAKPSTSTTNPDPNKIKTDPNASGKIKTDPNASTKIKTNNSSGSSTGGSIRPSSTGTRNSIGGGTSFGK